MDVNVRITSSDFANIDNRVLLVVRTFKAVFDDLYVALIEHWIKPWRYIPVEDVLTSSQAGQSRVQRMECERSLLKAGERS